MYLKAPSRSSLSNTHVGRGWTAPDLTPSIRRSDTWLHSGLPSSNSASNRMPWKLMFLRNTAIPVSYIHYNEIKYGVQIFPYSVHLLTTLAWSDNAEVVYSPLTNASWDRFQVSENWLGMSRLSDLVGLLSGFLRLKSCQQLGQVIFSIVLFRNSHIFDKYKYSSTQSCI